MASEYFLAIIGVTWLQFSTIQMSFGFKGGFEAMIHSNPTFLNSYNNLGKVFLKIDFKNTSNSIAQDELLREVNREWQFFCIDNTVYSQICVQEGDPCSPLVSF